MATNKTIVGLDLGSNSIGWAVVKAEKDETEEGKVRPTGILAAGSRILPMDSDLLSNFEKGNSVSQTETRRQCRIMRRMGERRKLRRARLLRVMRIIGWLPAHLADSVDEYGNIRRGCEPKIEWDGGRFLFQESFEEMCAEFGGAKVSHDWTVYYLRKKALRTAVSGQELAWILLNFNQKRGYKASRADESEADEDEGQMREVVDVTVTQAEVRDGKRGQSVLALTLDDGGVMEQPFAKGGDPKEWIGQKMECLKTTTAKNGEKTVKYTRPSDDDWTLKKVKTEKDITSKGQTVGEYIYASLLANPAGKLRGGRVTVVDRSLYRDEIENILRCQERFHPELSDHGLLEKCAMALYPNNEARRKEAMRNGLTGLICDDIILYQRPLKSKKSTIADCPFETRSYMSADGEVRVKKIKCAPRSHPLFQEFRLWQTVNNLRVADENGEDILTPELRMKLFDALTLKDKVDSKGVLKILDKLGVKQGGLKPNMVDGKSLPCYETRSALVGCLAKAGLDKKEALRLLMEDSGNGMTNEMLLWQTTYSVTDRDEFCRAIGHWAERNSLDKDATAKAFLKIKPVSDYAAYSLKAIKRLLPLMRMGGHWSWDAIDERTRERITHILTAEDDSEITDDVREAFAKGVFTAEQDFQGLLPWQACLAVYGKLSGTEKAKWESADDVDCWVRQFRHGSLRNPIVEQVVLETMRVVADIWRKFGKIDEIHMEMARELKKTNDERKRITDDNRKREDENEKIRLVLRELAKSCDGVNPFSPIQQTKLKICMEGARANAANSDQSDERNIEPSMNEIEKYKIWLEGHYQSPYTGQYINLSRLFTTDYEIEHVVPRSRYYDDSFNNKVICEAAVNKDKGNMMGMEYIKAAQGREIELGGGHTVTILSEEKYENLVRETYRSNFRKRDNLLRTELPTGFNNRQMNDTRYISVLVKGLLSNIVRGEEKDNAACSKNLVVYTGTVTDRLKQDWGMNDKWNEIILPRFEALDKTVGDTTDRDKRFVTESNGHLIPTVPTEMLKGFNKKRIDHRHHAMDAIVIACANRAIVQYFSNEAAGNQKEFDSLKLSVCHKDSKNGWVVNMPWDGFAADAKRTLEGITASFKHRARIVTKTTNHYTKTVNGKRETLKQSTYAIRQSLHKDTVWGEVDIRRRTEGNVKLSVAVRELRKYYEMCETDYHAQPTMKIVNTPLRKEVLRLIVEGKSDKEIDKFFKKEAEAWQEEIVDGKVGVFTYSDGKKTYATRFLSSLADMFGKETDEGKIRAKIASITDTGIQKILLNHLTAWPGGCATAFSADGIKWMNDNIQALNGGKRHMPIYKVRRTETSDAKVQIGQEGNKGRKFVEADKGTNLFFAVYSDGKSGRSFDTITLRTAVSRLLKGLRPVPETNDKGERLIFSVEINGLVYIPLDGEAKIVDPKRIYKLVSSSKDQPWWRPANVAQVIQKKAEFGSQDKITSIGNTVIKNICLPIEVDRLGNVTLKKIDGDD
ncbi:MAG: type II CRISPR RNA-guided endonuclease Cas9 [Marinilabiliaceae bacterium]